ncbi:MAG: flavodoxin family protein [Hyphomicrobiales bacterium]|nr:MAG: flavodoxin family protein [Hyphomicrobiales bacterium]
MPRTPSVRKGMPDPTLDEVQFRQRFASQFQDPAFDSLSAELECIASAAWDAYTNARKSPRAVKAGEEFADPEYELASDWLRAHSAIELARLRHDDPSGPTRLLLINGSSRSEHTCPGEMSKSWRLVEIAKARFDAAGAHTCVLDLARLASEYGRHIHPCKACFSTAAALCHWPCSCYPNYALGQTQDWMNEIYPMWVEAHGVMIIAPVNWYQAPSGLKLMIDRLVCADGGNPDPTRTQGKNVALAKELELADWPYPRHLAGRVYSIVVHGDVEGAETLRRMLSDWLSSMHLETAGAVAELDRYIGYWKPYATSHDELDADTAIQEEVRLAADTLITAAATIRTRPPPRILTSEPRQK